MKKFSLKLSSQWGSPGGENFSFRLFQKIGLYLGVILFEICPRGDFEKKKSLKMPLVVFIFELGGGGGEASDVI